jgi:hypothetical protein
MIKFLPFFYPLIDRKNCFIFNDADSRGFISIAKLGELSYIPDGIERVQKIYRHGKPVVSFFSVKVPNTPKIRIWTLDHTEVLRVRVESVAKLSDEIPLIDLDDVQEVISDYAQGQKYNSIREANQAIQVQDDGIKIGDYYFTILQSNNDTIENEHSIRVILESQESHPLSFYLLANKNIVDLNTLCYDLKRTLFRAASDYYEPKGTEFEKMMASAFPGNSFAVNLKIKEAQDAVS